MKQQMHRFETAFFFLSNFRGETSYSHVHHAENKTRGISFLEACIHERVVDSRMVVVAVVVVVVAFTMFLVYSVQFLSHDISPIKLQITQ
jgi:hypothetical protein